MSFFQKNKVLIVMIPLIIGSHLAWGALQSDKRFVATEQKQGQPLFVIAEKMWNNLTKKSESSE